MSSPTSQSAIAASIKELMQQPKPKKKKDSATMEAVKRQMLKAATD